MSKFFKVYTISNGRWFKGPGATVKAGMPSPDWSTGGVFSEEQADGYVAKYRKRDGSPAVEKVECDGQGNVVDQAAYTHHQTIVAPPTPAYTTGPVAADDDDVLPPREEVEKVEWKPKHDDDWDSFGENV